MVADQYGEAIRRWVFGGAQVWSDWHSRIWHLAEPAWREYQSAEWYSSMLVKEGFSVERGSGGMPTAFSATWSNGDGPSVLTYAEYDAVVGNCQAASTEQECRDGLSPLAPGHTDPHSALGISTLVGTLAAQHVMQKFNIPGTLRYTGEPAEKVQGSKVVHGLHGYYDDLDAIISFHPFYMLPLCNTVRWDTHCGAYFSRVYTFETEDTDLSRTSADSVSPIPQVHSAARSAGANTALSLFHLQVKALQDSMLSHEGAWSLSEAFLATGVATADNLPAPFGQIQYSWRAPTVEMAESILRVIESCAEGVAMSTRSKLERRWVAKNRPGIPNHALAKLVWENLQKVGPPRFSASALEVGRALQRSIGVNPTSDPFMRECGELIAPQRAEEVMRAQLPSWQRNWTSDDYTEMTWYAPTVRFYVGRPALSPVSAPKPVPSWVSNALGGIAETIDPMIASASQVVARTVLDVLTKEAIRTQARREYEDRIARLGGNAPCLPESFTAPIDLNWPDYSYRNGQRIWPVFPLSRG